MDYRYSIGSYTGMRMLKVPRTCSSRPHTPHTSIAHRNLFSSVMLAHAVLRRAVPRCARSLSSDADLKRTALHDYHVELGKMVLFAGYSMPVQYPDGVLRSTCTRASRAARACSTCRTWGSSASTL